jgi:hypothetical protein
MGNKDSLPFARVLCALCGALGVYFQMDRSSLMTREAISVFSPFV